MVASPQMIYLLIRHYSDEAVGSFDTTERAFADETDAETYAKEQNAAANRHPACDYFVQKMPVSAKWALQRKKDADERAEIRRQAFEEAALACETRILDIDQIFRQRKLGNPWVALIRREPRECAARIRKLI